jgi:hypothetical protein
MNNPFEQIASAIKTSAKIAKFYKLITAHQVREILAERGVDSVLVLTIGGVDGSSLLVEKETGNVLGRVQRSVMGSFNLSQISRPMIYYKFEDKHSARTKVFHQWIKPE